MVLGAQAMKVKTTVVIYISTSVEAGWDELRCLEVPYGIAANSGIVVLDRN